jgi:hypothetical protein
MLSGMVVSLCCIFYSNDISVVILYCNVLCACPCFCLFESFASSSDCALSPFVDCVISPFVLCGCLFCALDRTTIIPMMIGLIIMSA